MHFACVHTAKYCWFDDWPIDRHFFKNQKDENAIQDQAKSFSKKKHFNQLKLFKNYKSELHQSFPVFFLNQYNVATINTCSELNITFDHPILTLIIFLINFSSGSVILYERLKEQLLHCSEKVHSKKLYIIFSREKNALAMNGAENAMKTKISLRKPKSEVEPPSWVFEEREVVSI